MNNKSLCRLCLAIIMLLGLVAAPAFAEQASTPAKPATTPTAPSASKQSKEAAPTPSAAISPEKVVLKVGEAQVTKADIDFLVSNLKPQDQHNLATQGLRPLADEYVRMLLLSQQAINDHLESAPGIRERIQLQRQQMLAQAEYQKIAAEIKVSPEEISQYFTAHQSEFETAQVREFVIRKKAEGAKEPAVGLSPGEAQAKADSIRKALAAGTDAKKVKQDFELANVVMIDPEAHPVKHGQLLPPLDKAAFELKDGQVSEPMDTPQAIVFLQVVGHNHQEQKDAAAEIENSLKQKKLEAAFADLRQKTNVWMDDDYFKAQAAVSPASTPQAPAAGQAH